MKNHLWIWWLIAIVVLLGILLIPAWGKYKYKNLSKVRDYLYEISFDDYKFDNKVQSLTNIEDWGCSSAKNGNFYGRNFDFIYNDVPEFVIKVAAKEGRHASIGVGILGSIHEADMNTDKYIKGLELLPNSTLDGINDCGVICSDNVVPRSDTAEITGTNPEGEDLHISLIVRFVLDNASSADDAIKLLSERNIYGNIGADYNLHFMIADKDKTYIVEFLDNKMVAEEKEGNDQLMTNYYVNLDELTENSAGVERLQILKANYDEGSSLDGMRNLLKRVRYSNAYNKNTNPLWLSEFVPQSELKESNGQVSEETITFYNKVIEEYWDAINNEKRTPVDITRWHTTHNSTYDIENKVLRLTVQEDYDNYYDFKLD